MPHLFPILVLHGQKLLKCHLIQENSLVAMKAIYKLGITVQDLVNNYSSGLLIPFYEMVIMFLTMKSQHSLKSFGVLF